jgi:putative hydrolase of the HAD superfamily
MTRRLEGENAKPVRNVVFDFGGVLVRWRPLELIERFYPDGPLRGRVREMVFEHPDWVEMDRGTLSDAAAVERFAARLGRPEAEMHSLLQHVKDSLTPLPDTVAIVRGLKSRGVPLYGLSNMSAATFAYLRERYSLWDDFLGIVISAHIGLIKPDPRIFDHLCERYALDPAETLFIDDHLPNVESADRRGFRTIHFSDAKRCLEGIETHLDSGGPTGRDGG